MHENTYRKAQRMLNLKEEDNLPEELKTRLNQIDALANTCAGRLLSQECIAIVVYQYKRDIMAEKLRSEDKPERKEGEKERAASSTTTTKK